VIKMSVIDWLALLAVAPATLLLLTASQAQRPAQSLAQRCDTRDGHVRIPAGAVLLGEDGQDRPGRTVAVPAVAIDRHEVTNRQFAAFVAATGHRTQAEREGKSAVFVQPTEPVPLDNAGRWWRFVEGADWRHPQGPDSSIAGRENDPVVHVTREDAEAYAKWAGGSLPSEAQWERAARGKQVGPVAPTNWAFADDGKARANVWEGAFPVADTGEDGFKGVAPVGCFEANDFGVHDMVGNVWEWTAGGGGVGLVKGGSYLCAMNYCANFRPAGFQAQERDLGTSHIGFRAAYGSAR
jgi:formylglycine-generating enzyme required for sulfatase activity